MTDRIQKYRGCLALCLSNDSPLTQQVQQMLNEYQDDVHQSLSFQPLPIQEWHITLLTKDELAKTSADTIQEAQQLPMRCFPLGLGGHKGGVYFVVCVWPKAQAFRMKHNLPHKDFHVTVSTANNHHIDKTSSALLDLNYSLATLKMETMEVWTRQLMLEKKHQEAMVVAVQLCSRFGDDTTRGWLQLADCALVLQRHKLAMLCYARALDRIITKDKLVVPLDENATVWKKRCLIGLNRCAFLTEWGPVFVESELHQIPSELSDSVYQPWSITIGCLVSEHARPTELVYPSRERMLVFTRPSSVISNKWVSYRLPRFFRWLVPFHLSAMSTPRNRDDVRLLAEVLGIRHIITLTEEEQLPCEWFNGLPTLKNTFLPVTNYKAPTMAQIDLFIRLCSSTEASATPVLVHCGGGKGRAGTMLACYLVAYGFRPPIPADEWNYPAMNARDAIDHVRKFRPGSIETEEQERAVSEYFSMLWRRLAVLPPVITEPSPSMPIIEGNTTIEATDLLVLCGLPGSGKSSFRQALIKRSKAALTGSRRQALVTWNVLSSDEHGGRQGCERGIGMKGIGKTILDRCNGKVEDREFFLELASTWSTHATAVWFDFSTELCTYRAQQRPDHPTLPPGNRVQRAIEQHASEFTQPRLENGFQSIVRITSIEAAQQLVDLLSPPLGLLKFPRTPHLINLGAAADDDIVLDVATVAMTNASINTEVAPAIDGVSIVITEKMDGANMGISLDAHNALVVQNRSHYVNSSTHKQFRDLDAFLHEHREILYTILQQDPLFPQRFILYGEWMAATHSITYTKLQSLFYVFDLYDRETHQFVDRNSLERLVELSTCSGIDSRIMLTPRLWSGTVLPSNEELIAMVNQPSQFYDGPLEGIYIKWESDGKVKERSKIVRSDFIAGNEHWSKNLIQFHTISAPHTRTYS